MAIFLTLAAFAVASWAPYRVSSDTGFQLRGVQQWVRGEVPSPGHIRLPDAEDLSRDSLVWSSWWPPGFPFLYAPLARSGLPLGTAVRLLSFLFFGIGLLGWLRFADRLALPRVARLLYGVSIAACSVTSGGASALRSADNLSFALAPWLALLTLRMARQDRETPRWLSLVLCGAALGASYWIKYTLFFAALALAGWLALRLLFRGEGGPGGRVLRVVALGLGLALPVVAMIALHASQSGSLSESASGTRTVWQAEDPRPARPLPVLLGLAGAPGLGLFQSHLWMVHLSFFSDRFLPFLRSWDNYPRLLLESLLGVFGTVALVWGLWTVRWREPRQPFEQAVVTAAMFFAGLAAVSLLIHYNYLANEPRYSLAVMPLLHPFVLLGWLAAAGRTSGTSRHRERIAAAVCFTLFFAAPTAFGALDFAKNEVGRRLTPAYRPSSTGLWVPEISAGSVPQVQAAVASLLRSPDDVVVVASPAGTGESFLMWLEMPGRVFPVTTFSLPLGGRYLRAADLKSAQPLRSSRPLRVVVVATRTLAADGWRDRLLARFPQISGWSPGPQVPDATAEIWFGDLATP